MANPDRQSRSAAQNILRLVFSPSSRFLQWEGPLPPFLALCRLEWCDVVPKQVLSSLPKAVAQEIVELGDRIDLLDCHIQRIGNSSKFELVVF